ncbi:MAG: hypothetical protein OJF49_003680 [Ktedonobacterales bacterium]|nr:MAG: hypothetical protein OJF49_003680 [Ktedonobacterales bacterium]
MSILRPSACDFALALCTPPRHLLPYQQVNFLVFRAARADWLRRTPAP